MLVLIIGLIIFLGIHSISIINEAWRDKLAERYGEIPYKGLYSVISLVGFGLIIWGYGLARQEPVVVFNPPVWLRHIAILLLIPIFPLILATYLPGRIQAFLKHPMLIAIKLWALAHLLANGMLADILLFGSFLAWAVIDRISLKKRQLRLPPRLPSTMLNDVIAVILGLALFGIFSLWLHVWLIGVAPITAG